ncbi:MAG: hypothetical protein JWO67_966 [Streptosporangiaceae bacterium]|nr:hypothetical protein [Streptosporangiaceae bacterium]
MIDLTALSSRLTDLGTPLRLSASDTGLPRELRDLLGTMPADTLTLIPAPGGIAIHGGTLTVTATADGTWPVEGFSGLIVTLAGATLVITDGGTAPAITARLTGTMSLGGREAGVDLTPCMVDQVPGWTITLAGTVGELSATDLLLLGLTDPGLAGTGLEMLDTAARLDPASLEVTIFPHTGVSSSYTFTLRLAGARWTPAPALPSFEGVDIVAFVLPGAYTVELIGHLVIDGVPVDVGVGVGPRPQWTVFVRPTGGAFPGLAALVGLLTGADGGLAERTRASLGTVSDDSAGFDAAITAVTAGLNWSTPALEYIEIDSVLTLRALKLAVSLVVPDITLSGSLYEGHEVGVRQLLDSFGLPTEGVPAGLAVTAAHFTAELRSGVYGADLTVDGLWSVGPLAVQEVAVSLAYNPFDRFSASVRGLLAIGDSARLRLYGGYGGAGTGWIFSGATEQGSILDVGDVLAELASSFGLDTVPDPLRTLTLTDVSTSFQAGAFSLTCAGYFEVADTAVSLRITADITRSTGTPADPRAVTGSKGYTARYSGLLTIGGLDFDVEFDLTGTGTETFAATYSQSGDATTIKLRDLVAELSADAAAEVPADLAVGLKDVKFVHTRAAATAPATFALGLDLSAAVPLSGLPLVGDHLPPDAALAIEDLQIVYSSGPLDAAAVADLNALFGTGVVPLPAAGLSPGAALQAQVVIGSVRQTLSLGLPAAPTGATTTGGSSTTAGTGGSLVAAAGGGGGATAGGGWIKVQRSFGPVRIERIGLAYRKGARAEIVFMLDGSISVAGLTLSLAGLAVGVLISDPLALPSFDLTGLGLAYASGPLQIGGAFLKGEITYKERQYTAYSGSAQLRTKALSLAAIGSYVQLPEGPSLFVYAVLDYPLGGPPVFFVRGVAVGFGYNRRLVPPAVADIASFPLVAEAVGGRQPDTTLAGELALLADYLPPSPGDYFLAIGIHFTSFEMIDSFVLLIVGFGHRFELDVLGLSTLVLPAPDAGQAGVTPIAEVQLALRATLVPEDGYFTVTAQLTRNSFLLSRDCHLTGGFAFSTWFGDQHTGDFVVTVGGYHPRFNVPAHYPSVPRLGFSWQVTPQLALAGSAYFALTPGALMAGGSVSATWKDDALTAWFNASMDFLIAWQPYHYEANLHVSVGASYTFTDFGNYTVTAHVGADVRLWGPDFAGTATIDLDVISTTISFGSTAASKPEPLPWPRFREAMLPDTVTTVALRGGAAQDAAAETKRKGVASLGVADPAGLVLLTDSIIPSTTAWRTSADRRTALPTGHAATGFGVGPAGVAQGRAKAEHLITITHRADRGDGVYIDVPADGRFDYEPVLKNLPFALWGGKLTPALSDPRLISDLLTGYAIRPVPPREPAAPPWLARTALQEATPLPADGGSVRLTAPPPFMAGGDGDARREEEIMLRLTDPDVAAVRAALVQAVLTGADIDLNGADATGFHAVPQVGSYA